MRRREALSRIAILFGGSLIGGELLLNGCTNGLKSSRTLFTDDQLSFLDEVAETILPGTSSPGAKEANVGSFMAVMVQDCYESEDQAIFKKGIGLLNDRCKKEYKMDFISCNASQRTTLLKQIDEEQKQYMKNKKPEQPNHYFTMMKQLTLLGFFTSEEGATRALRYLPLPGRYEGCVPYKKGQKAWAI